MKNNKINKILSYILAIFMVLSMVPINAYSIDTEVGEDEGLEDLLIYTGTSSSNMQSSAILGKANGDYPDRELFERNKTEYVLEEPDSIINTSLRFAVVPKDKNSTVKIVYADSTTDSAIKSLKSTDTVGTHTSSNFAPCMTKIGKNTFSIVVTPPEGSVNKEVVYKFTVLAKPTLSGLELHDGSNKLYLNENFKSSITTYNAIVGKNTKNITFDASKKYDDYEITFDGYTSPIVNVEEKDKIEISVSTGDGSDKISTKYTIDLIKSDTYSAIINVSPNDSIFKLYDSHGVFLSENNEGKYSDLLSGEKYTYVVTKYGYVSKTDTLLGESDLTDGVLNITLEKAAIPGIPLPSYTGDWTSFRGNPENMGIINSETPTSAETAVLKWAEKYGTGWAAAPTPPLIINDALYIAVSDKVLKIDKVTGEKIQESEALEGKVGFALNPITYGNGMFFVTIGEGRVQALRADTLESLWVSENLGSKAQTISPVIYHDGYVYTGVWNSETEIGTYFCLSVTDEELEKKTEIKLNSWKLNHNGGFYWAGAYVTDNYLIVGSDDGSPANIYTDTAVLYSINPTTGAVLDTIGGIKGDIRSSVSFDKETNKAYFATKGGLFCTVKVNDNGTFDHDTFKSLDLGGMCTGTPLVYNDRAYIGSSSGNDQFGPGKLNVIDLSKESPELAYAAGLPGYPQASALLSSAYGDTAYVYITYNNLPGGIYVIEDKIGQTSAKGYDLFIPDKEQQQYSIASLVADSDGTIYYKNDSCYLIAVENNTAYLKDLSADKGNFDKSFTAGNLNYELVVPIDTNVVTLNAIPCDGGTISFNGSESPSVELADGKANVTITVINGTDIREYKISIREASNNTELSELNVNESNTYNSGNKVLTPVFENEKSTYGCFGITSSRTFVNLWPTAKIDKASVKVYAVSNIRASDIQNDGTINVTSTINNHNRYALYFADGSKPIVVRIVVTAEDGVTKKDYKLIITKESAAAVSYASKITLDKSIVDISSGGTTKLSATLSDMIGTGAQEIPYWYSSDEDVATVDQDGTVTVKKGGSAIINVKGALTSASCTVNSDTDTDTVIIAAYDYTAVDAGLSGASSNGKIMEKSIKITDSMSAKEAILSAFNEENIEIIIQDTMYGPYISSVNKLAAGTGGGMSGWLLNYNNDDFSNLGLETIKLKNEDRLVLHYSVNPDASTDDVGNGWYGLPIVNSFTLQGQKVVMSKETSYDELYNPTTTYYIQSQQETKVKMQGDGTEENPFIIPISLPTKTNLSALTAEYTTSLNPHYRIVTGLDGEQNYTNGLKFSINTLGGKYKTYYNVLIKELDDEDNGGGNPSTPAKSYITLSIDKKTIDKGYVLSPTKVEITEGESVWNVFKRVLDNKNIDYDYSFHEKYNSVYIESIDGDGEFDHGSGSGWMYNVNGWYPNYGASLYELEDGDVVQWRYTTDLGADLGEDITKWDSKISISGIKDNEEVTEEKITVTITAKDGNGKRIVPTVQLNGKIINGTNDKYTLELKEGTNKLSVTAKDSMDNEATEELSIKYVKDGSAGGGANNTGGQNSSSNTAADNLSIYNDEAMISSWAKDLINKATSLGIVQGHNNMFNPKSNITRAEFIKIIASVLNLDVTAEKSIEFTDVSTNDWFYPHINAAYRANIVTGTGNEFRPNDNITREQMAVIIVRALNLKIAESNTTIKDSHLISDWAKVDVETAIAYGLMVGDNNNFEPKAFATREMATVVAMRVYDYVNEIKE